MFWGAKLFILFDYICPWPSTASQHNNAIAFIE